MENEKLVPEGEPPTEETAAAPEINTAACATLMKHIGKKFVVREPILAVQMEEAFAINREQFPAGSYIAALPRGGSELSKITGPELVFVGVFKDSFNYIYRPARKPRKA